MIRVVRGAEPTELATVRARRLAKLASYLAKPGHTPSADEIGEDYQVAKSALFKAQWFKCAYCELPINMGWSDVEHFRPKAEADRKPGCTHPHGYWWLAWTWENLLLSCNVCNRPQKDGRGKGVRFPLDHGSVPLTAGQTPPGQEKPLLHDPTEPGALDHIVYRRELRGGETVWVPRARNGSQRGDITIRLCALDLSEKIELYTAHVRDVVSPEADAWNEQHPITSPDTRRQSWIAIERKLYAPSRPFVALSYDALCVLIDDEALVACGAIRTRPP